MTTVLLDAFATSTACVVANLVTHPLDTLKVRQQLSGKSLFSITSEMIAKEGLPSFYSGLSSGLIRAIISGGGRLLLYNQMKLQVGKEKMEKNGEFYRPVLGILAGTIAAVAATPFDLARTLKQSDEMNKRPKKSLVQTFSTSINERGFLSLWSGSSIIIMRQAIFTSAQLSSYDMVKKSLSWYHNELYKEIFASIFSGIFSTLIIAPLELVKTHLQVSKQSGLLPVVRNLYYRDGLRGFWRGSASLYMRLGPHTAIVLIVMDQLRILLNIPRDL